MVGPGHAVQGTHAEVLGYAVLSLVVVVVFVCVQVVGKVACDCCVVHTAGNLAVVVVAVAVVVAHGKETAVAAAAVFAVTGVLEIPVDFPTKKKNKLRNLLT